MKERRRKREKEREKLKVDRRNEQRQQNATVKSEILTCSLTFGKSLMKTIFRSALSVLVCPLKKMWLIESIVIIRTRSSRFGWEATWKGKEREKEQRRKRKSIRETNGWKKEKKGTTRKLKHITENFRINRVCVAETKRKVRKQERNRHSYTVNLTTVTVERMKNKWSKQAKRQFYNRTNKQTKRTK